MKKLLNIIIVVIFALAMTIGAIATGEIRVLLNGKDLSFDVPSQNLNGRVLVPLCVIFEEIGAKVVWDSKTQTVSATKDNTVVMLTIGDISPTINGKVITIDQPGKITVESDAMHRLIILTQNKSGEWEVINEGY